MSARRVTIRPYKLPDVAMKFIPVGDFRVLDGDTVAFDLLISEATGFSGVGMYIRRRGEVRIRAARVQAPEMKTGAAGEKAKAFTQDWLIKHTRKGEFLRDGLRVVIVNEGADQFGNRIGAELISADGSENLSDLLLRTGNAVPYKK